MSVHRAKGVAAMAFFHFLRDAAKKRSQDGGEVWSNALWMTSCLWEHNDLLLSTLIKNITANVKDRVEVEQPSRGMKEAVTDFGCRGDLS
jgi:hypothetical protein